MKTLALLFLASLTLGCATDDDEPSFPTMPAMSVGTCTASIEPRTFEYRLEDAGQTMVVQPGRADEAAIPRISGAPTSVVGLWLIGEDENDGIAVRGQLSVERDEVTVASQCTRLGRTAFALARSPAVVTDVSIEILTFDTVTVEIR